MPPKLSSVAAWLQPVDVELIELGVTRLPLSSRNWKWIPVYCPYCAVHPGKSSLLASCGSLLHDVLSQCTCACCVENCAKPAEGVAGGRGGDGGCGGDGGVATVLHVVPSALDDMVNAFLLSVR